MTLLAAGGRVEAADLIAGDDVEDQSPQTTRAADAASGWVCPGCSRIWGPAMLQCIDCNLPSRVKERAGDPVTFDRRTKEAVVRTLRERYGGPGDLGSE